MHGQSISLLLTSTSNSVAAGGETTISTGLTFHAHRKEQLQVVAWSVHNLTYALVSAVNLPISQSCAVCHASAKHKNLIQHLKSRNKHETNRNVLMFPSHPNSLSRGIPDDVRHRNTRLAEQTVTPCNLCTMERSSSQSRFPEIRDKSPIKANRLPVWLRPQIDESIATNIPSTEM